MLGERPSPPTPGRPRPSLRSRRVILSALTVLVVTALTVVVVVEVQPGPPRSENHQPSTRPPLAATPRPDPGVLGVYAGYQNQAGVQAVTRMLDRPVKQAMDFFDPTSWSSMEASPARLVPAWSGYQMTWSIEMLPNSGGSLRQGATGAYNGHFKSMAASLVALGEGSSVIRLGWEFNGFWYPWGASACESCFVAYWRQVVGAMRSVPGAKFEFEWSPSAGLETFPLVDAYPGDAWVDIVGLDIYDEVVGTADPTARWSHLVTETAGLDWITAFAAAHAKPIAFPEWGLGWGSAGGGDNAYFIRRMAAFIATHRVVSAIYWDYVTSTLDRSPHARKAFAASFS
jgi:hypothetical protein